MVAPSDRLHERIDRFGIGLVATGCLLVWGAVLAGDFHYDDFPNVVNDPAMLDATALWARLAGGFRPLTRLSYFLDQALWGMRPAGFLLTNLLLHLGACLGVFGVARLRWRSATVALIATYAFLLQPAHAEVVAYVSARSTGLMATCLIAALYAHERSVVTTDRWIGWRVLSVSLFGAACLSKEVAVVFPLLLVVWEATRADARTVVRRAAPVLVAAGAATIAVLSSGRMRSLLETSLALRSPVENLALQAQLVPQMLSLWIRPGALSLVHEVAPSAGAQLLGGGVLVALLAVAAACRRRAPEVTLAVLFALVALLPTQSVFARVDPFSDRALYLAWLGPALLLGAALPRRFPAWRGVPVWVRRTLAATAIAGAAATCGARIWVWNDDARLWTDTARKAPGSTRAWNNLGLAYLELSEDRRARAAFCRSLSVEPDQIRAREGLLLVEHLIDTEGEEDDYTCESYAWWQPPP